MANKQTIREEFIFKGSDEDFKRLIQGDENYELFREMNKRIPPILKSRNPFLLADERSNERFFEGGNYTIAFKAETLDTTRVIIEGEAELNWLPEWISELDQQGLVKKLSLVNESATIRKLLPTKPKTINQYKKAWHIWQKMVVEYQQDVIDGRSKQSKPKWGDFRDRVISVMGWTRDTKTLQNVVRLGEAGLLD